MGLPRCAAVLCNARSLKLSVLFFVPYKAAAMIESSKAFSKDFMAEFGIPTAAYVATTDFQKALAAVRDMCASGKVVVKASGLAAGKGVLLPETLAITRLMSESHNSSSLGIEASRL